MKKQKRITHRTDPQSELDKANGAFDQARQALRDYEQSGAGDLKMLAKLNADLQKARARSDRAYRAVARHEPAMA